jgi:HEAT repeat protein
VTPLAQALRDIIEAEVDETLMVTETAIDIIGPIDLEDVAEQLIQRGIVHHNSPFTGGTDGL